MNQYTPRSRALQAMHGPLAQRPKAVLSVMADPGVMIASFIRMPAVPLASLLLSVVCSVVLIMVGVLCQRAWHYAAVGTSFIGSLKGERISKGGTFHFKSHAVIRTYEVGSVELPDRMLNFSLENVAAAAS
jgi:hypothetical protein